MAVDPYAAIRRINIGFTPGATYTMPGEISGTSYEQTDPDRWTPNLPGEFGGKYLTAFRPEGAPEGILQLTGIQRPGMHKYDTLSATYQLDPATGQYVLMGDPMETRETSSRDRFQDSLEKGSLWVGSILGAGYLGSQYLGTGASGGTAAGTAGTTGATGALEFGPAVWQGGGATAGGGAAGAAAGGGIAGGAMAPGAITSTVPAATVPSLGAAGGAIPTAAGTTVAGGAGTSALARIGTGLAGQLISGAMQNSAAQRAAAAQQAAAAQGQASLQGVYDRIAQLMQPYVGAGVTALDAQQALIGTKGPEAQKAAIAALESSPEFASLVRQGEEAILANASATGNLRGGNVQAALGQFRPAVLSQLINQQIERLAGLSQQGQNAAAGVGTAGVNIGTNQANLTQQSGAAAAGGALARGSTNAGYVNAISQALSLYFGMGR